jgi:hypothetical protein
MCRSKGQTLARRRHGHRIYSIALLQKHPQLKATVLDGPEVLKVTAEMAAPTGRGPADVRGRRHV